jgi:hypothetical protein
MSWKAIEDSFPAEAVELLRNLTTSSETPEIDPSLLQQRLDQIGGATEAAALLDAAASEGLLRKTGAFLCSNTACGRRMTVEEANSQRCPHCSTDFCETGDDPEPTSVYETLARSTRDVPWLIAIHGMNTPGAWQEEFSWRIAHRFKYHAPVLIYKYGVVRLGVLFRWKHRALTRQLGGRIRAAMADAAAHDVHEPPDMVVHSFGSQLFRRLLEHPDYEDLRFGRVIACGSVIRPDFDWGEQISRGRVESVLNHCGDKDLYVPLAQFMIPGSGPGGRHGFTDPKVTNVLAPGFAHSDFFHEKALKAHLERGGIWDTFLRHPVGAMYQNGLAFVPSPWRARPRVLRGVARTIAILLIVALAAAVLIAIHSLVALVQSLMEQATGIAS